MSFVAMYCLCERGATCGRNSKLMKKPLSGCYNNKLFAYYTVNGNFLRLRSEVTAVYFDQVTAKVTAVTYGTAQPYTKELYMAAPY